MFIQPQVPLRLPCYDFTLVTYRTVILPSYLLKILWINVDRSIAYGRSTNNLIDIEFSSKEGRFKISGTANFHGVTGGVYKVREHIHRGLLIHDY
jgi:hypothetical protein